MKAVAAVFCATMLALVVGMGLYWLPNAARMRAKEEVANQVTSPKPTGCDAAIASAHPELASAPGISNKVGNVSRHYYLSGTIRSFECSTARDNSFHEIPTPLSDNGAPGWIMNDDGSATLIVAGGKMTISPDRTLSIGNPTS